MDSEAPDQTDGPSDANITMIIVKITRKCIYVLFRNMKNLKFEYSSRDIIPVYFANKFTIPIYCNVYLFEYS